MTYILNTAGILFAFGLVIFVHELGHFLVAKKLGVKVERFSFGLGPEMIGFQWGETRYCIAWLPLGGEVRMAGEFPGDEPDGEKKEGTSESSIDRSRDFFAQSWYRRIYIALAGPFMNYVLAVVLFFSMLLIWGEPIQINKTEIGEVISGMPAEKAGIQKGDKVVSVQGEAVEDFMTVAQKIQARPGLDTEISINRNGQQMTIHVTPQGETGKSGLIGIKPADPLTERKDIGVAASLKKSFQQCWTISYYTVAYLGQKIAAREKPDMAGPLGIGQVIIKAVKAGWEDFFYLIALISVAIGLFNLFPIPLLDGGHILYYVIEGLRGKPLSQQVMGRANMVGLAFLLSLLMFATVNDVQRFKGDKEKPTSAKTTTTEPVVENPVTTVPATPEQK